MTKKQICTENPVFAYYSGFTGLEFHKIEYGIEDFIYCVSGAWGGKKSYHRLKIHYDDKGDYIRLNGYKIPLNECIRMGV
jgi:hypothetical protein